MTGPTKILTVSYGTFSCTLEGFDDPFGTMRGIAEYFRDLAADDRYFGAEPPTPDVEMLQRIAEKEVQRRVEARMGESGVALTQLTDAGEAEAEAEVEAHAPVAEVQVDVAEAGPVAKAASDDVEEQPVAREAPIDDGSDADLESGPLTHDDEYLLSDEPEDVLAVDPTATPPSDGPAETVAEKLRRIRAVVSRSIEPADDRDGDSFSDSQARDAADTESEPRRDRAHTRTIQEIARDLSDEDETPDEAVAENAFGAGDELGDFDDAETSEASDGWDFDTEGLVTGGDEAEADLEEEELEAEDTSDILGSVLSKARAAEEEAKADEEPAGDDRSDDDAAPRSERRVSKPLAPIAEEGADVGRILAETDNQLNNDESVRRRRVISQMRAAVAATKADRLVSRKVTTREDEEAAAKNAYRSDLSEVVREVSRPAAGGPKDSERRPSVAPLVLVSSQRVDDSAEETAPGDGSPQDFAGFAKSMGAKELPDLMEAAAAYTSFVEGQASFSRPEIMKRVARVDPSLQMSREDGLRSFGQLLRQGKLRKLERGQFTIADTTRFKPAQRFAGE